MDECNHKCDCHIVIKGLINELIEVTDVLNRLEKALKLKNSNLVKKTLDKYAKYLEESK